MLPQPDYVHDDSNFYGCAGLRLAFDPTKSPYYKVVRAGSNSSEIVIQIYCLETGNRSLCRERFNYFFFVHFDSAIYWNNALHFLETENSIVLGETKEDSFMVINLSGMVMECNLISKTLRKIYDMGSNQVADDYLHGFIPPFAMYDMGSKNS
ncbi:hypothetical protein Tco_1056690 [Tanacetum coccineum]|uniref:Uncharacterized protein n=1 Tax=Tanacetum coccineum TaxID=301880 RepID=A0ABQ5H3C5_9ASTR